MTIARPISRSAVNGRSVLAGLLGVVLISAITPFNDQAVNNTYLIGTYLPTAVVLLVLAFVVGINGPLWKWRPRWALGGGEMAVALGMMLVGCAVPSSGLMRYLPNVLVGVTYQTGQKGEYLDLVRTLNLPGWIFPTFRDADVARHAGDPVIQDYWGRAYTPSDTFAAHWRAVPWSAWARPALAWGIFVAAMWGAILCGAAIVRKQWVENERLPFPLAGVMLSLIEPPGRGRVLNSLLRSRSFWLAAAGVFFIHAINALHLYDPKHFPETPLKYDMRPLLATPPWSYIDLDSKWGFIYFAVIGLTFFVQTRISFSLWFIFLVYQAARMAVGHFGAGREVTPAMQRDELFGAVLPYAASILWVGREHWTLVGRSMRPALRGRTLTPTLCRNTGRGGNTIAPLGAAGWGLVGCAAVMAGWLVAAGASLAGAVVIVLMMLMVFLCIARIVAETGLMFGQLFVPLSRPWVFLSPRGPHSLATLRGYFLANLMTNIFTHDVRENLSVYATHAMKTADDAETPSPRLRAEGGGEGEHAFEDRAPLVVESRSPLSPALFPEQGSQPRYTAVGNPYRGEGARRGFFACLLLSLLVAFFVSGASQLYTEYTHAVTLDREQAQPLSNWAANTSPMRFTLDPTVQYQSGVIAENHHRLGHFTLGLGLTAALSVLRLRLAWWPLHPVGFLMVSSYAMQQIWVSVLLGWLIKVLVVRFGGMKLFRAARALFIGLVIGEAAAAGFWLLVSLVRVAMGLDYHAIRLFPA